MVINMSEDLSKMDIPRPLFDFIYMSLQNFLEKYPETKNLELLAKNFSKFISDDLKMSDNEVTFKRDGNKGTFKSHCNNCMICFTNKALKERYGPEGAGCWMPGITMTLLKKVEPNISKIDWTVNEKPKTGECILEYEITFRK